MPAYENLYEEVTSFFSSRFGVAPSVLEQFTFIERQGGEIWAASAPSPPGIRSSRPAGVRALRRMPHGLKPTTVFLCLLGGNITSCRAEVSDLHIIKKLLLGQPIPYAIENGYAAISYRGDILGCAVAKEGSLRALIPTQKRRELLGCMESEV